MFIYATSWFLADNPINVDSIFLGWRNLIDHSLVDRMFQLGYVQLTSYPTDDLRRWQIFLNAWFCNCKNIKIHI